MPSVTGKHGSLLASSVSVAPACPQTWEEGMLSSPSQGKADIDIRATLELVAQEYERLHTENCVLRGSIGSEKVACEVSDHCEATHHHLLAGQVLQPATSIHPSEKAKFIPSQVSCDLGPMVLGATGGSQVEERESTARTDEVLDGSFRARNSHNSGNRETHEMGATASTPHESCRDIFHAAPPVFEDEDGMKKAVQEYLSEQEQYDVCTRYKEDGIAQAIARSGRFEYMTFGVIIVNAVWMWTDTDLNDAEVLLHANPVFFVAENLFCLYFTAELLVRFVAFANKLNALRDAWFVFDTVLVVLMVFEVWFLTLLLAISGNAGMSFGGTSLLRLARLIRLLKMLRVARLVRTVPELFILTKAILAASRATGVTLLLLFLLLYVYAILFCTLLKDTLVGEMYFASVWKAMMTLLFRVALADSVIDLAESLAKEDTLALAALISCVVVSTISVMNILIGVLVEAIAAIAERERNSMQITNLESVLRHICDVDLHRASIHAGEKMISKHDLVKVTQSRAAVEALDDAGVDVIGLIEAADSMFEMGEHDYSRMLTFNEFMEALLQLRGSNMATVKDILDLKKYFRKATKNIERLRLQVLQAHTDIRTTIRPSP